MLLQKPTRRLRSVVVMSMLLMTNNNYTRKGKKVKSHEYFAFVHDFSQDTKNVLKETKNQKGLTCYSHHTQEVK